MPVHDRRVRNSKPQADSSLSSQIIHLEEQKSFYEEKCEDLQQKLDKMTRELERERLLLEVEKIRSNLFLQLLNSQTDIKIEEIIEEKEDGIHVYDYKDTKIPIIVHEYLQGGKEKNKKYTINCREKGREKGKEKRDKHEKIYRSVKNRVKLVEENPEEQEEKVKKVDETFDEIIHENFDVSLKEVYENIDKLFDDIQSSRMYKKYLLGIKNERMKLLGKMHLEEYTELIKTHTDRLESIFVSKKHDKKKKQSNITISLSALDQRLISHHRYYESMLEPEEIKLLKLSLKVNMSYPKRYIPFTTEDMYNKIYNYSLAIFPVKEIVKRAIVNPYGFSNVVYLEVPKSSIDDPYSFYTLEKIKSDGTRCWKMECRLDHFSRDLAHNIRTYCIELFRKIYMDTFSDNLYREDYTSKAPITQQDCEQLLLNILLLTKLKNFCNLLRKMVVKHCTISPTEIDKFSLTGDDRLHKKQFIQEEDYSGDLTKTIKRLFDDISDEEARNIWEEREEN